MTLLPGDILMFRVDPGAPLLDRLIGWGESKLKQRTPQGYQYYHVAFVSADVTRMYSAQPPTINLYPIENPLPSYIEVYRVRGGLSPVQLKDIFNYADSRKGKCYDFIGVGTFGFLEIGGLEFCSQFTEDSFANGQVVLSPDIRFTTPDDVADSPFLVKVQ
jgi:hypothetical protein